MKDEKLESMLEVPIPVMKKEISETFDFFSAMVQNETHKPNPPDHDQPQDIILDV